MSAEFQIGTPEIQLGPIKDLIDIIVKKLSEGKQVSEEDKSKLARLYRSLSPSQKQAASNYWKYKIGLLSISVEIASKIWTSNSS